MGALSKAFTQFFVMLEYAFSAVTKIFITADNLATVAEETSGEYKDQARINRVRNRARLDAQQQDEAMELAARNHPKLSNEVPL